jgi:hypothetical protein
MTAKTAVGDPPIYTALPLGSQYPIGAGPRYGDTDFSAINGPTYMPIRALGLEPFAEITDEIQLSGNQRLIEAYIITNAAKLDKKTGSECPKRFVIMLSYPDQITITARSGDNINTYTIKKCKIKFEEVVDGVSLYLSGEGEWEAESVQDQFKIVAITLLNRNSQEK